MHISLNYIDKTVFAPHGDKGRETGWQDYQGECINHMHMYTETTSHTVFCFIQVLLSLFLKRVV